MSLTETLNGDLKAAMKARDKQSLSVLRMLKSALMNEKINAGHDLTADEEVSVISRELKQRRESLSEFEKAGRQDLVDGVQAEIVIVEKYMPKQLSDDEVKQIVAATIKQVGATGKGDFGKVMGAVMPKLKGQADGKLINQTVKSLLN
ncbi:GatB/YqeY domain-containing protein [Lactiplantibacillus sp. WILCCON 0030]|uniref:GatB/YqeY domain-containing protein n=1 Tax=Lactiplantibacillus brownii TaxID=3069269 RepID=A0ABU1A9C9_9LACO|nr:GatB/YqeY domain-containing protein [Lactiplantibacillus brownii]MDQ7937471.1 GatB/YqeY domain-containing protein [Lactiplantibacillus brownii]